MSLINSTTINNNQILLSTKDKREKYGEIFTPYSLIERMFEMLTPEDFTNPNSRWLDPGAGTGYFSIYLFWKLDAGLTKTIRNREKRRTHIVRNMIYMVELQEENITTLRALFGDDANIICADYLADVAVFDTTFDYVIGNPPYNKNGIKKVPTNRTKNKKCDGTTLWFEFVKKSVSLLKEDGTLLMIVPSLWMKPDKAGAYDYITQHKIVKVSCLTNTETNRIFGGTAQTPTCFFLMKKSPSDGACELYDKDKSDFVNYIIGENYPIPVFGASVINRFLGAVKTYGALSVKKTNMPGKHANLSDTKDDKFKYENIKTARLDGVKPALHINYSTSPLAFHGVTKLVLPHKMYGFPFVDLSGNYGISNRDNYVIHEKNDEELGIIAEFLSTKTALYVYEATRYRMKYLEKYAFMFLPDVTKIPELIAERPITDKTIGVYFGFDEEEKKSVERLHNKTYDFAY